MKRWKVRIGSLLCVSMLSLHGLVAQQQAAEVNNLRQGLQLAETLQPTKLQQKPGEEISPSDTQNVESSEVLGTNPAPPVERMVPRQDSLTPTQSRELSPIVTASDTAMEDIGTGLVPEPAKKYSETERMWLPDGVARGATYKYVFWRPSCVFHNPLYFEDAMLERHGHVRWGCLQPLASGGKFFTEMALFPYLATLRPYRQTNYVLGHYRAGSCAPLLRDHLPWDKRAAAVEAAFWGGFFWALPTPW